MLKSSFIILVIFLFALSATAQSSAINWQADYATALSTARKSGKPVLLDFTAKWCAPCQEMEKTFWTRSDVAEAMKSFVAVKIDYDAEKKLVNRFAVRGLPYIAFSDPIGNLITFRNNLGANGAATLKQISNDLPKDFSALEKAYKAYDLNDRDGLALLEIADFYRAGALFKLSGNFYERAARVPLIYNDTAKKERVAFALGLNAADAKDFRLAAILLVSYLQDFPAGAMREQAFAILIANSIQLGDIDVAEKHLVLLKSEFPQSKNIAAAQTAIEQAKNGKNK